MNPFRPTSSNGARLSRKVRKGSHSPLDRSKLVRRKAAVEALEERALLSAYNPQIVQPAPLPVEGASFGAGSPVVARFDDGNPAAGLTATVAFPSGTTTATVTPTGGVEFVPGVGNVPQYQVRYTGNWTPPKESAGVPFAVTIHDATDGSNSTIFGSTTAAEAPLVYNNGFVTPGAVEGTPVGVNVAEFFDSSPTASISDYKGTVDFNDGTGPQTLTFTAAGGGFFIASNTHTFAETGSFAYNFTITDTAPGGTTLNGTSSNPVAAGPVVVTDAPISNSGQPSIPINAAEGQHLTNIALGSILDGNINATASDFTGFINWGDGTPIDVATFTRVGMIGGQSLFLVTGNHTFAHATGSPFSVSVGITDKDSGVVFPAAQVTLTTSATVVQTPLAVSTVGLSPTSAAAVPAGTLVGTFSDNAGGDPIADYSASFDFGDGTTFTTAAAQLTIVPGVNPNTFNVVTAAAHTYAKPGLYATTLTANDSDPAQGIGNGFANVAAAALTPGVQLVSIGATEGQPLPAAVQPILTFTYGDTTATPANFTATIDWGDGTGTQTATVTETAPGAFTVNAQHTYAEAGTYTANYSVQDTFGQRIAGGALATVADAALSGGTAIPVFGSKNQPLIGVPVATFVDANPLATPADFNTSIDWGDGTTTPGIVTEIGVDPSGAPIFQVTGDHMYGTSVGSPFGITVNVTDEDSPPGPQVTVVTLATISSSPIQVSTLPISAVAGQPVDQLPLPPAPPNPVLVATFTDPAEANLAVLPGPLTASIDWGDGTPADTLASGVTIQAMGGGVFGVFAPITGHTYANPGIFVVKVTVGDSDPAMGVGGGIVFVGPGVIGAVLPAPLPGPVAGVLAPGTEGLPLPPTVGLPVGATGVELATFSDSDLSLGANAYTIQIDWGDGSPQSTGQVVPDLVADAADPANAHFIVTGEHTYHEAQTTPYTITVFITQNTPGALFVPSTQTVHVTDTVTINDAKLTAGTSLPIFAVENQQQNDIPVATFTDANPFATAADFSATINWGDGTGVDPNARVVLTGGTTAGAVFTVYGSHSYNTLGANNGNFATSVTIQDEDGSAVAVPTIAPPPGSGNVTVSQSPIIVTAAPLTPSIGVPVPAGKVVATFTNSNAADTSIADYIATIDWGDGVTGPGVVTALGGGQFQVASSAPHTYSHTGVFALVVTVLDTDPATGKGSALVFVSPATLTLTPTAAVASATEGNAHTFTLGTFTDSNPAAVSSNFVANIDWGDGSPDSLGTITGPVGGVFTITGTHTYLDETTTPRSITIALSDNAGGSATGTTSSTVSDALLTAPTPIAQAAVVNVPLNAPLGTFTDGNPLATPADFAATINWGDGSAPTVGLVSLVGGSASGAVFSVSGSHIYTSPSPAAGYPVVISILDDGGSSTTIANLIKVTSSALSAAVFPISAVEGAPTPAGQTIGTITDGNGSIPVGSFTVTINWGDTSTSAGTVVSNGGGSYSIIAPAHTYGEEGSYILSVTVSDGTNTFTAANVATVGDAALTGANGGPFAVVQGNSLSASPLVTFIDANLKAPLSDFTATIDWGDGTPDTAGTISQPGGIGTAFDVAGSHVFLAPGTYTATVTINDDGGSTTTATATITVSLQTITFGPKLTINGYSNTALTHVDVATFTTNDPAADANEYQATIVWGDGTPNTAGDIVEDTAGVFHVEGSHTYTQAGTFTPTIIVSTDDPTLLGSTTATVTISQNPLLVVSAPVSATEGNPLAAGTIVATFTDSVSSDPLSAFTATIDFGNGVTAPGTVVSTGGGNFQVKTSAAVTYAEAGTYLITVSVTDTNATAPIGFFTASSIGTATVKDAALTAAAVQPTVTGFQQTPLVQAPPILGIPSSAGVVVSQFTDGNPTAPLSDFTATIDWGDGTPQSAGQLFQPGGPGTAFFVLGNHSYAQPSPAGTPYVLTVTIKDVDGSTVTTHTTAAITASTITGTPVTSPNPIQGVENQPLSNVVVAFFTDSGTPGPLSSYTAMINWGDGSPATIGAIVPLGGNTFEVQGSHTYAEENVTPATPYSITVTITHNGAPAATVISQANIADAPISGVAVPISATEGTPFTGIVAVFTDTNTKAPLTDYPAGSATINWGNGSTTTGKVVQPGGPGTAFEVLGTDPISGNGFTYSSPGTFPITVTVKDIGGSSFTAVANATVGDAKLIAVGVPATATLGPIVSAVGLPVTPTFTVATFTDTGNTPSNPAPSTAAEFTVSINWGDGVVTPGTVTVPPSGIGFQITGTHLYGAVGTYSVTTTITDNGGGATTQATSTVTITDAKLTAGPAATVNAVEGTPFTTQVTTFTYGDLAATPKFFTATINWGDGTAASPDISAGTIVALQQANAGTSTAAAQFAVAGSHTYVEEGTYAITVTINDNADGNVANTGGAGSTVTGTASATVLDAPLSSQTTSSISGIEGNSTGPVLVAVFQDSNPMSTLSDFTTGKGSVTINWGDGATGVLPASALTPVGSAAGVTYQVTAAHLYAEEGTYQITVTATDAGGSATVAGTTAVIHDAPLAPAPSSIPQPTVSRTEGTSFGQPVGIFMDANPSAPVSDFTSTIDWGDGTPRSTGTIAPFIPAGAATNVKTLPSGQTVSLWEVLGSHNYLNPMVGTGTGMFPITINVHDKGGASTVLSNTASVTPVPLGLTGTLNPLSDTGKFHNDGITNDTTPEFDGTTEPLAVVRLFVAPVGTTNFVQVGSTSANAAGDWSIITRPLADGRYTVMATATDRSGLGTTKAILLPSATEGPLVIDTIGPRVTGATFDRLTGTVTLTFADNAGGSGMLQQSLADAANYGFNNQLTRPLGKYIIGAINVSPGSGAGPQTVALTIETTHRGQVLNSRVLRGFFQIGAHAKSVLLPSGIQDLAGNALDGEYYGPASASGNGVPGGDFVANFNDFHNIINPPATVIGFPHPNDPAGHFAQGSTTIGGQKSTSTTSTSKPTHNTTPFKPPVVVNTGTKKGKSATKFQQSNAVDEVLAELSKAAGH